jgi:hypothetical protein
LAESFWGGRKAGGMAGGIAGERAGAANVDPWDRMPHPAGRGG